MPLAYHVVLGAYGFWLPNDPRGSWSDYVRSWELFVAGGPATKTETGRSVAGAGPLCRHGGPALAAPRATQDRTKNNFTTSPSPLAGEGRVRGQ